MATPQKIIDLVERFERNKEAYMAGQYNETQVRREFIDPFFKELGWDIDNEQGYAEAYKDVVHEDAIRIGGMYKAPDYCMRIGGVRKFFVEAKKPSVNVKDDTDPAFQVRRYAWSAKLALSVLTDFQELAVYDCRIKPVKNDKSTRARIAYFTYKDYAEKWDEIASIFSRDAVLKGSFDKYAEKAKQKKGSEEVDEAFLKEIEKWRELLAKNIALRNTDLSQRELNYAVQVTIDRLVFLRICEDRGIEQYGQLLAEVNGTNIYGKLIKHFRDADARYNSGLFHFKTEKDQSEAPDSLTLGLTIDDAPLKEIISHLYYPESPYEFSVLSADILGQVYEQFLGKVIRLTEGHQAKIEEKPEVRKAGGVYYTPAYIVKYIVENTIGKLVNGKTPKEVAQLKICDPACGSGSFLLGAYQFLLDWHLVYYTQNDPKKWNKQLTQGPKGDWRLVTAERKRILISNIYGVDIDVQAVEVTKLSLLLKVLEGETQQSLQTTFIHERVLPNLSGNIKCGNSLVAPDFYAQQMSLIDPEEQFKVNAFSWDAAFPSVFKVKNAGFDAVIGNPPYGASLNEEIKQYLISRYNHQNYQLDSYLLFLELSLKSLLAKNGYFGMIIPNPWLTNLLQQKLRKFIVKNSNIVEIVHFLFAVFPKVTVDTQVIILRKSDARNAEATTKIIEGIDAKNEFTGIRELRHKQDKWIALEGEPINIFLTEQDEKLQQKLLKNTEPLINIFEINVGIKPYQTGKGSPPQTKEDVENRVFDSATKAGSDFRSYLRGKDINRYVIAPIEPRYLKFGSWLAEPRPAAKFDAPLKIFMRQTGDSLIGAIDENKYLCLNNMHVLVPKSDQLNIHFVLGLINSKLMNWYYQTLNPEQGEALAEVKKSNVEKLRIKIINSKNSQEKDLYEQIIEHVKAIMELQKKLLLSKTPHEQELIKGRIYTTNEQIDKSVYQLYELSEGEIKLIEATLK